jgi:hypothetical protein
MNQDHASAPPQTAETMLNIQATPARPTAYDKAIAFKICDRFGTGESLEAILAEPGMPDEHTFCRWLDEDSEVARQFRVKEQVREILADQKMAMEAKEREKRSEIKYRARRWMEMYPLIGPRPVLSTESEQAYTDLLTAFSELLQPQDIMAQILVKQAVDATWEEARYIREKTQLPEREYREYLEAQAQRKKILPERTAGGGSGNGAGPASWGVQETEVNSAKSATALDHARGLERGFRYYQALEKQQMQAAKRRTLALRELEHWNKGLGRRARELSDRFIWAETICPTQPPAQAAPALAPGSQSLRA